MATDFHLIGLELGSEAQALDQAMRALDDVGEGETAFFSEYLAWTPDGSHEAFVRLLERARTQRINLVTTLNLGEELIEDLPAHEPDARYNSVVVFTQHGAVHAPQAKVTPQVFENVTPYERINRAWIDLDGELLSVRFFVCSDIWALTRFSPEQLRCDLMIVLGNFAAGAEERTTDLIGRALKAGVAETAIHVNAYHNPRQAGQLPLAIKVEEVLDSTAEVRRLKKWRTTKPLEDAFYVYRDRVVHDFREMADLPREGRIAIPRSRWRAKVQTAEYPVTIVL